MILGSETRYLPFGVVALRVVVCWLGDKRRRLKVRVMVDAEDREMRKREAAEPLYLLMYE